MIAESRARPGRPLRDRGLAMFGQVPIVVNLGSGNPDTLIGTALAANFNITTDQAITLPTGLWRITRILVTNASTSMTTAVGGFYDAASKGGNAVVAATQVYSALTSAAVTLSCTIAAPADWNVSTTLYFALTTAQGAAATAAIRIYGVRL